MVWYTLSIVGRTTVLPPDRALPVAHHLFRRVLRRHARPWPVGIRRRSWSSTPAGPRAASPGSDDHRGRRGSPGDDPGQSVQECGIVLEGTGEDSFCRCSRACALGLAPDECGMRRGASGGGHGSVRLDGELERELGAGPIADEILPQLVEALSRALHLSYLAVEMMHAGSRVTIASHGRPVGKLAALPFTHEGETVAWMVFGRSSGKPLRRRDCRALRDLVTPVGAVTQTLRHAVELQRLREQLTAAREEERRRLRRDLHDGVAPSVAAAALHLETAEELIRTDPSAARDLIGRVRQGTKDVVEEIRRLAGCLGHSSVDQVGLLCAIRERASCFADAAASPGTPDESRRERVVVEAAGDVESLPAATEAAAFHLVSEVLALLYRNGSPTRCHIRLGRTAACLEAGVSVEGRHGPGLVPVLSDLQKGADMLGAALNVEQLTPESTVVRIRLPLLPD